MSLLRNRGGGLLAAGPAAIRAAASQRQNSLLKAARSPNVISAPSSVIQRENPLNSIGPGLAQFGQGLGNFMTARKRKAALDAARAPIAVAGKQEQPAGYYMKNDIEVDPSKAFLPNELDRLMLQEAIELDDQKLIEGLTNTKFRPAIMGQATTRDPSPMEQAQRLFSAGYPEEAKKLLSAEQLQRQITDKERKGKLTAELRQAIQTGDEKTAQAIMIELYGAAAAQAYMQSLNANKKEKLVFGGRAKPIELENENLSAIEDYNTMSQQLEAIKQDIDSGLIELGLFESAAQTFQNETGLFVNEEDRRKVDARNRLNRFKTQYVNSLLRLAKGVQTDGDAKRVRDELLNAQNVASLRDALFGKTGMQWAINKSMRKYQKIINQRRRSYGEPPVNFYSEIN